MTEFRRELVLHQREFGNGVVRDKSQRTSGALFVVVDAFDREVIVVGSLAADGRTFTDSHAPGVRHAGTQQR